MASTNLDPSNFVDQMRLNTGDFIEDEPYLEDSIYVYFYNLAGNSVIDGSIMALESIINNIALSPQRWQIGDASETGPLVEALTARLVSLQSRRTGAKVPVILRSDRKNWNDFDKAFGGECSQFANRYI
jgi:hypothetical protein